MPDTAPGKTWRYQSFSHPKADFKEMRHFQILSSEKFMHKQIYSGISQI
jgi:hypothetical protein